MAEAIDLLEKDHGEKTDNGNMMSSWTRNVFRTAAFNAIIATQMALIKYLTERLIIWNLKIIRNQNLSRITRRTKK